MRSSDLPVWARVLAAPLLVGALWYISRSDTLLGILGSSVVPLTAGVVGVSLLLGMRVTLGLWPGEPIRAKPSISGGLAVTLVFALALWWGGDLGEAEFMLMADRGAVALTVVGGAAWALAFAVVDQRRWILWLAAGATIALAPFAFFFLLGQPDEAGLGTPLLTQSDFWRTAVFSGATAVAGSLITYELAFRRTLIGAPARAGVLAVLGSALAYVLWRISLPDTLVGFELGFELRILHGGLVGVVAGSLYVLSRSLLVSGLYFGLYEAIQTALVLQTDLSASEVTPPGASIPGLLTTGVLASILLLQVGRQSSNLLPKATPKVPEPATTDAAGD